MGHHPMPAAQPMQTSSSAMPIPVEQGLSPATWFLIIAGVVIIGFLIYKYMIKKK